MMTCRVEGVSLRARTERALFRKAARVLGGRDYFARLDCWNSRGERVFEITAATWVRGAGCWEVQRREFVTVEGRE